MKNQFRFSFIICLHSLSVSSRLDSSPFALSHTFFLIQRKSMSLSEEETEQKKWREWFETLEAQVDTMYRRKDMMYWYRGELKSDFEQLRVDIYGVLHSNLAKLPESSPQSAAIHYLLGKLLNLVDDYNEEARSYLLKAQKLKTPHDHLRKVLVCLSLSDRKQNQLIAARDKMNRALKLQSGGSHLDVLMELVLIKTQLVLSILKREPAFLNENKDRLCCDIIQHANEALPQDVVVWKNRAAPKTLDPMKYYEATGLGKAYYYLGVGHFLSWCVANCKDGEKLLKAIDAFKEVGEMKMNVSYLYMSAMAAKYIGDYQSANYALHFLVKVYPNIDVGDELQWLKSVPKQVLSESTSNHCIAEANPSPSKRFNLDMLKCGSNKNRKVVCQAISVLRDDGGTILCNVCDRKGVKFVLVIHGVHPSAIPAGARLILDKPYLNEIADNAVGRFKSVFLSSADDITVNGKKLTEGQKSDVFISPPRFI